MENNLKAYKIGYLGIQTANSTLLIYAKNLGQAFEMTAVIIAGRGIEPYPEKIIGK